ncbi:MAG TPA: hypothetical protein VMZ53_05660 [Kofleriaceae bacterium]|nr:hypothetical protein [Kofleriaceae bacterium]
MGTVRVVVVIAVVALSTTADAGPTQCRVFNNTDHELVYYGAVRPGEWFVISAPKEQVVDGSTANLEIPCSKKTRAIKLTGGKGSVSIEALPSWFDVVTTDGAVRVTAPKTATVTIDGATVKVAKGVAVQKLDLRTRALQLDLADVFAGASGAWTYPINVAATLGKEQVSLSLLIDTASAGYALVDELRTVAKQPVTWAAEPDHLGPALIMGCPGVPHPITAKTRASEITKGYAGVRGVTNLTSVSMVAICEAKDVKLDECPKSKDPFAKNEKPATRYRRDEIIHLYEAKSGKSVASTTLQGGAPPACRDTSPAMLRGEDVTKSAILAWMNGVK